MKRVEDVLLNRVVPLTQQYASRYLQRLSRNSSQSALSTSGSISDIISLNTSTLTRNVIGYSSVGNQRFMSSTSSGLSPRDSVEINNGNNTLPNIKQSSLLTYKATTQQTRGLVSNHGVEIQPLKTQSPKHGNFYSTYVTGDKPIDITDDYVIKGIFSDESRAKDFLESILIGSNKILPEGTKIEGLEYLKNEHIQDKNPNDAKKVIFDLQVKTTHGIFIIEMQKTSSLDYLKRAEFYNAIAYSHQHIKGPAGNPYPMKDYTKALPIVTITILTKNMFNDKIPCVSYHVNLERRTQEQHMKAFSYVFIELEKFDDQKYDKTNITTNNERDWLSFMKTQDLNHLYENPQVNNAIKYVQDIRDNKYDEYIRYHMSELATKKELEEAEANGVTKTQIDMAKEMLKESESIEKIVKYTKLTKEQVESLKK